MARWILVMLPLLLLAPSTAAAQEDAAPPPEAEARALFEQGLARADEERWAEAVELFRAAIARVERPSIAFNLGVALFRLGELAEAQRWLERFVDIAEPDAPDVEEAQRLLGEMRASMSTLELMLDPPEASVEIDGDVAPGEGATRRITLDPGRHRVVVAASGRTAQRFEISMLAGSAQQRAITLEALPATLVVDAPADAEVWIDDALVGRGPREESLRAGSHVLRVVLAGRPILDEPLALEAGARVTVAARADLAPASGSIFEDPLFWVIGGGLLLAGAGAAVGIGVAVTSNGASPDPLANYAGSANVVIVSIVGGP